MKNGQWSLLRCYLNALLYFDAKSITPTSVNIIFSKEQLRLIVGAKEDASVEPEYLNKILKEANFHAKSIENDRIEIIFHPK